MPADPAEPARRYLHRLAVAHRPAPRAARLAGCPRRGSAGRGPGRLPRATARRAARVARGRRAGPAGGHLRHRAPGGGGDAGAHAPLRRVDPDGAAPHTELVTHTVLLLLGWQQPPLRWARYQEDRLVSDEVPGDVRFRALQAMIDLLRDPRAAAAHDDLGQLLRLAAWQFALGRLDQSLLRLQAEAAGSAGTAGGTGRLPGRAAGRRRVRHRAGRPEARPGRRLLEGRALRLVPPAGPPGPDRGRRARLPGLFQPPAARRHAVGRVADARAGVRHPAGADRSPGGVPEAAAREGSDAWTSARGGCACASPASPDGNLPRSFELLGVTLLADRGGAGAARRASPLHLHRPMGRRAADCCWPSSRPQAAALVHGAGAGAGAVSARGPRRAGHAGSSRCRRRWTSSSPRAGRAPSPPPDAGWWRGWSCWPRGALKVRLAVRPVKLGPVFAPGEGPGAGARGPGARSPRGAPRPRSRSGRRRHALAERLGLGGGRGDRALVLAGARRGPGAAPGGHAEGARRRGGRSSGSTTPGCCTLGSVGRRRHAHEGRRPARLVRGGGRRRGGGGAGGAAVRCCWRRSARGGATCGWARAGSSRIEETPARRRWRGAEAAFFEYRGTLQVAARGQRSADRPGRERGADRGQRRVLGPAPAHRRGRRRPARAARGPGVGAASVPEGGRDLAGAAGALGGGGDPRRRDGPGKDRADAGAAAAPGGERAGAGGGPHLGGARTGSTRRPASRPS